jgi:hypothetical protein
MIALKPGTPADFFAHAGVTQYPADLFPIPVDVANRDRLKRLAWPQAEREAVHGV